ncbi:hypothetical protein MUK42_16337 [Musa troglodytarum]|uniref:Uncharacterized protein n=1 Tax=Musa troglodytarum TaxID=320322 RepID=A0A9E7HLR3_9LILI|nr:hypothetical protein MUK42_16337 [Musa troglodytarum]
MVVRTTFLAMGGSVSLLSVSTTLLTAAGCFALGCLPANAVLVIRIGLKMGKRKIAAAQCSTNFNVKIKGRVKSLQSPCILHKTSTVALFYYVYFLLFKGESGQVKVVLKIESDEDRFVLQVHQLTSKTLIVISLDFCSCEQSVSLKIKDSDLPFRTRPVPACNRPNSAALRVTSLEKYELRGKRKRRYITREEEVRSVPYTCSHSGALKAARAFDRDQ